LLRLQALLAVLGLSSTNGSGEYMDRVGNDIVLTRLRTLLQAKKEFIVVAGWMLCFLMLSSASLVMVSFAFPNAYVWFELDKLPEAVTGIVLCAVIIPFFLFSRFSFGFVLGFCFFAAVTGFVWISYFSPFHYDHRLARLSSVASLIALLIPLLFFSPRIRQAAMDKRSFTLLLVVLLMFSALILVCDATYGFVFDQPLSSARTTIVRPSWLNYFNGMITVAILPYAFAYFSIQRKWSLAILSIVLGVLFYPVLVNKTILLMPFWLPFLFFLFNKRSSKVATVLSLLIPMIVGMIFFLLKVSVFPEIDMLRYPMGIANLRMLAIPSAALDHYADFFNAHPLTGFCQISLVQHYFGCPYTVQLGLVFAEIYKIGNFNASLLATEGLASVGFYWAPLSAFVCGLILSIGNGVSERLPVQLVVVSSGIVVQALLNVPLTTALLSNGTALLFLLWYLTPRDSVA
jgi:hypothetical protein